MYDNFYSIERKGIQMHAMQEPSISVETLTNHDTTSFRPHRSVALNSGPSHVYKGGCNSPNESKVESYSSSHSNLQNSRNIGRVSVLYNNSPHSSCHSLQPPSRVLEESSIGDSRSLQHSVPVTPLDLVASSERSIKSSTEPRRAKKSLLTPTHPFSGDLLVSAMKSQNNNREDPKQSEDDDNPVSISMSLC